MKNLKKVLVIFNILIIIILLSSTFVQAIDNPGYYNPDKLDSNDVKIVKDVTGSILGIVKYFGMILSVVMLSIIGLKYMLSSVDEKASYKENLVPYVAGCALLACATILPSIIYNAMH